eukprot:3749933-Pleurochrysis_carterae.AAC.1
MGWANRALRAAPVANHSPPQAVQRWVVMTPLPSRWISTTRLTNHSPHSPPTELGGRWLVWLPHAKPSSE